MPIAVNPDTGEAVYLDDGGQWQPAKRAVNPQTKEMLAFDGKDWKTIPSQKGKGVMGYVQSAIKGLESGLSFGFSPQIAGLLAQSGMAHAMSDLSDEQVAEIQKQGGLGGVYDRARDEEKAAQQQAAEEHPYTHLAGELGSAFAIPVGGAAAGAGLGARMGRAAAVGAGFGALSGAGSGEGLADRAERAALGGVLGGATAGLATPVVEGVVAGGSRVLAPIANAVRGRLNTDDEAARRVVSAIERDRKTDPTAQARMTTDEFEASALGGGPAVIADLGGETTRGLARSAANTSPEGRHALNAVINPRFEDQGGRVVDWLQDTFNYPDATSLQKAIDYAQKTINRPMYERAYQAGDRPLWSPKLEQLASSPDVVAAMRNAAEKGKSRSVLEGYGGFNTGVTIDQSGNVTFQRGPTGVPTYPNLQFWDYTKRALDDMAGAAKRQGRDDDARVLTGTARQLREELDSMVPSYKATRSTAAALFGAEDALEAGQNFVTSKMKNREAVDALAKMKPVERKLFQDGFVSKFIDVLEETGDRRNVLNQIGQSTAARKRLMIALGPDKANELEAGLRVEGMMDLIRGAVQGNSTTARQLAELGLAGGPMGDVRLPRGASQLVVDALGAALGAAHKKIDKNVSRRVAEMLASNDPAIIRRGNKVISKNQEWLDSLRALDQKIAAIAGQQAGKNLPLLSAPAQQLPATQDRASQAQ